MQILEELNEFMNTASAERIISVVVTYSAIALIVLSVIAAAFIRFAAYLYNSVVRAFSPQPVQVETRNLDASDEFHEATIDAAAEAKEASSPATGPGPETGDGLPVIDTSIHESAYQTQVKSMQRGMKRSPTMDEPSFLWSMGAGFAIIFVNLLVFIGATVAIEPPNNVALWLTSTLLTGPLLIRAIIGCSWGPSICIGLAIFASFLILLMLAPLYVFLLI